jgi:catechol 2,3-dioxygenase-like lactoylglutathione lyase family enzyme
MAPSVHISLNVSDLARSIEFYRLFFGEPRKLKPDYAKFVSEEPEIHLALQPGAISGPGQLSHLGIRVDSAERVREWKRVLDGRGLPTREGKREVCCYALQEKFWVTDPDGNRWEIYTVLEDVEEKSAATGTTCCRPETASVSPGARQGTRTAAACC